MNVPREETYYSFQNCNLFREIQLLRQDGARYIDGIILF